MMHDWKVIYREGDYELVEIAEHQYSLIRYTAHLNQRHIGSIDRERAYTDLSKATEMIRGPQYKVIVSKPYDPETDSDAEQLGGLCGLEEAIQRLWENRLSIHSFY